MNKKEVSEIRRLFTKERCNISKIATCYVNHEKEVLLTEVKNFLTIPEEEMFKYLAIFSKSLSGNIGKNLYNIECNSADIPASFMDLTDKIRNTGLKDEDALKEFYENIIDTYQHTGNYLIVVVHGAYDIPGLASDGTSLEDSEYVYNYLLCCICPVELSEAGLAIDKATVKDRVRDWVVGMPANAILYPAFNNRNTDIHNALFYAKKPEEKQDDFIATIVRGIYPLINKEEKEWFTEAIHRSSNENCALETMKNIQNELCEIFAEQMPGENNEIGLPEISQILKKSGFTEDEVSFFKKSYDENVGRHEKVMINNITDTKHITVKSDEFTLKITADRQDMLETKMIDGRRCLVLPLSSNVLEFNNIPVNVGALLEE